MKRVATIFSVVLILIVGIFFLQACSGNNNNDNGGNEGSAIALTLQNYQEYFTLQEEILNYSETPYTKNPGNFSMIRANQTTKVSISLRKSNIEFENVSLTIENDTFDNAFEVPSGNKVYKWKGYGGILNISYNGSGSASFTASYDDYASRFTPMHYKISAISGNVKIK